MQALWGCGPERSCATIKLMLFMITAGAGLSVVASSSVSPSFMLVYGLTNVVVTPIGVLVADRTVSTQAVLLMLTAVRLAACVVVQAVFAVVPSLVARLHRGRPRAGFLAACPASDLPRCGPVDCWVRQSYPSCMAGDKMGPLLYVIHVQAHTGISMDSVHPRNDVDRSGPTQKQMAQTQFCPLTCPLCPSFIRACVATAMGSNVGPAQRPPHCVDPFIIPHPMQCS